MSNGSPDPEADRAPSASKHETVAASEVLDDVKTGKSHSEVDSAKNDLSDVTVAQASRGKDTVSIVEDKVGPSKLLE